MNQMEWKTRYFEEKECLLEIFGFDENQIFRSIQKESEDVEMEKQI